MAATHTINLASIFRILGLNDILDRHRDHVRLWHNHALVEEQRTPPIHLQDGDYFKILAGEHECISDETEETATDDDMADLDPIVARISDDHAVLLQKAPQINRQSQHSVRTSYLLSERSRHDPLRFQQHTARQHSGGFSNIAATRRAPHERIPPHRMPPQFGADLWLPQTGTQFLECARTEQAGEGPVVYWTTWFLHTTRQRRSSGSRLFRADGEQELWYHDLCNLWSDVIEPDRVLTNPPCTS